MIAGRRHASMADAITELLEKHDLAAVRRALSKLAMAAAQAEDEEACDLSTAARDSGALPVICNLVGDPDPRCHNAALAVLVSFTMTEVDPDAHLNRALISDCGGFAYILERLFSESPLTIGLACGALQNLCRTSVGHVASLAQRGGTERLRALTSCGDDHVAVAANACLHNLLGWHEAASRLQIRYLRHSRKVHVHEASGHNVAVGSSANRGTAAQSLIRIAAVSENVIGPAILKCATPACCHDSVTSFASSCRLLVVRVAQHKHSERFDAGRSFRRPDGSKYATQASTNPLL